MKARKKKSGSLLTRLLGGGKKKEKKPGVAPGKGQGGKQALQPAAKARPLTRLERSIAEVKQMAKIGEKDPERLARLLTSLLAKEREKRRTAQERFDRQVWDIVHRSEEELPGEDGASGKR